MIRWAPLSPQLAAPDRGLPAFAVEEGFTDVARRAKKLKPFAVEDVADDKGWLFELLVFMGIAVALVVGTRSFVAQPFYIPSGSMLPQLQIDDRIVVNKLAYARVTLPFVDKELKVGDPRRGDIVVFDAPEAVRQPTGLPEPDRGPILGAIRWTGQFLGVVPPSTEEFVKRVIALPGETVHIRSGEVFVNGKRLEEPYLAEEVATGVIGRFGGEPFVVPEGHIFVMGDNRAGSSDGRVFGPIPIDSIVGRAFVKVWPLGSASFL